MSGPEICDATLHIGYQVGERRVSVGIPLDLDDADHREIIAAMTAGIIAGSDRQGAVTPSVQRAAVESAARPGIVTRVRMALTSGNPQ